MVQGGWLFGLVYLAEGSILLLQLRCKCVKP